MLRQGLPFLKRAAVLPVVGAAVLLASQLTVSHAQDVPVAGPPTPPSGAAWAWGRNPWGQLGDGTTTPHDTPEPVAGPIQAWAVSASWNHSLVLATDGTVRAFGRNNAGQLGDGTTTDRHGPVAVSGLTNIVAIAASFDFSLALRSDGTVWGWGNNNLGQLGNGSTTPRLTPTQVTGITSAVAIGAGALHGTALLADGTVRAWGDNSYKQLGDGTTAAGRLTPVPVVNVTGVSAIAAGGVHNLALRTDGTVWAWGNNSEGQLGDGTQTDSNTRVSVLGLDDVVGLAAGSYHSMAVRGDGTAWAWGMNADGQLGEGTRSRRLMPVQVTGLTNVAEVGASAVAAESETFSMALRADGSVMTWGGNGLGQLGDGTTTDRLTPVPVVGLAGVVAIGPGALHSLVAVGPPRPVLDVPAAPLRVGASNAVSGRNFTAGTVLKLFVATASGPVAHGPFTPTAWTANSLTVSIPATVPLGQGFGSLQVVNTDQGYAESNVVGALLEGDPALNLPTILFVNGVGLGPADPAIGVAHADTVVPRGVPVTIVGTGFNTPAVNLFTAAGNVGPLWPLAGGTATTMQVVVPVTAPAGPGSFQVVNSPYTGNVQSNAVAAVIGAPLTITSVNVAGTTVTVTGTGFSALSVINLFNLQGGVAVNLGGLAGGTARVPLTLVSDTEFHFTRPAGAVAGPAFVEVLNPPFIPFASSGTDPDGAFTFP